MTNPNLTKLRLLHKRAQQDFKDAKARMDAAWDAYLKAMRADGLCPGCEKSLKECKCVFMAGLPESGGMSPPSPITAPDVTSSSEQDGVPARQSGSPEVDRSGERQFDPFGLPIAKIHPPMPPVKEPRK